jgi:hypothetical protein
MVLKRLVAAAALLAAACGPSSTAPVDVMALVVSGGKYEARQVQLSTVRDVVALRGDVATLTGNARIIVDGTDPALQNPASLTEEQLSEIFVVGKGMAPRANYIEKDGVLWPADFHSWNMVTTYYNFERAFEYFRGIYDGKSTDQLLDTKVYYFPAFVLNEVGPTPLTDNALFFSPIQAFAILPFESLQKVPLSINQGVIGHEFSHQVFNQLVYGAKPVPDPLIEWLKTLSGPTPAVNLLKALDEGLADYHSYGVTCASESGCNSRYLVSSFDNAITDQRDIARPDKCLTKDLVTALTSFSTGQYAGFEYRVGTVIASALYFAGEKTGKREVLQKSIINAYSDSSPTNPGLAQLISINLASPENFTLPVAMNAILAHIPDEDLRKVTCNEFLDRLQISCTPPCAELPACPASSSRGIACPPLDP